MRIVLPPGGPCGPPSSSVSASSTSSIDTTRRAPGHSRNAGFDATAAASEAHEARIARFSAVARFVSRNTSRGCSKTEPGWSSAFKSITLSILSIIVATSFSLIRIVFARDSGNARYIPPARGRDGDFAAVQRLSVTPPWPRAAERCWPLRRRWRSAAVSWPRGFPAPARSSTSRSRRRRP